MNGIEEFHRIITLAKQGILKDAGQLHLATGLAYLWEELDRRLNDIDQKQQAIYVMLRDVEKKIDRLP